MVSNFDIDLLTSAENKGYTVEANRFLNKYQIKKNGIPVFENEDAEKVSDRLDVIMMAESLDLVRGIL